MPIKKEDCFEFKTIDKDKRVKDICVQWLTVSNGKKTYRFPMMDGDVLAMGGKLTRAFD